ncbi:MAG: hypothetical protein NW220_07815 [Leptolyngbyaceae cyanobacterium bins.349]|nr:hypothetical protein [Leptolyngbyaceae cyanobacterium bins.349]
MEKITFIRADPDAIAQRLRSDQTTFISPQVVTLRDSSLGFKRGILIRDPDGHPIRLVER